MMPTFENDQKMRWLIAVLCVGILVLTPTVSFSDDHLLPEDGIFGGLGVTDAYHMSVRQALLKGTYRDIQMITLTSFKNEKAVYIERSFEKATVVVRWVSGHSIWRLMNDQIKKDSKTKGVFNMDYESQRKALSKIKIKVEEKSIEIDFKTADLLSKLWDAALSEVKYEGSRANVFDGSTFYFANFKKGIGTKSGVITSPNEKTKMFELVSIGLKLHEYGIEFNEKRRENHKIELVAASEALLKRYSQKPN